MAEYMKNYHAVYYKMNKPQIKVKAKEYYEKNKKRLIIKSAEWRKANPDKYREACQRSNDMNRGRIRVRSHEWYLQNKQKASQTNRKNKLKKYGLTEQQFEALLLAQQCLCAICQVLMQKPVVDHDHETGKARGILCPRCNAGLGMFQDRREVILRAATYLMSNSSYGATETTNSTLSKKPLAA